MLQLDSGGPPDYLKTATSNLIPCTGTQSYRERESSVCGILMKEQGEDETSSERLEEHGGGEANS